MRTQMNLAPTGMLVETGDFKLEENISDEQGGTFQEKAVPRLQQLAAIVIIDNEQQRYFLLEKGSNALPGIGTTLEESDLDKSLNCLVLR